jgi:hypothetical protein
LKYDIVVLGATCAALGLAGQIKEKYKILIIHDTTMIAGEFIGAYNTGSNWKYEPKEYLTKEIRNELIERNIMNEKGVSIYSAGSIFNKGFRELGIDILLDTKVLNIKRSDETYIIELFNCAGHSKIEADFIIDTGTERLSKTDIVTKSLNCILSNKEKDRFPDFSHKDIVFEEEQDDKFNTVIMKLNCSLESIMYKDRQLLIDLWRQMPESLKPWKIAAIGLCHEIKPSFDYKQIQNNYILMPGAYYANPLIAMDEGAAKGRSLAL